MIPRPLVYLGPSAPAEDILKILPDAVIRPPVRRGDLYRDRMLRFSVFLILDGVFAQEDAISPREVVDVLEDGAAVLGAASMGALRAVDCGPAGAEGAGLVHRLFQREVVSSEDEVAVIFQPERPYPSASLSLIHIRVALRRAVRAGLMARPTAQKLVAAAQALHFSRRSWRAIAAKAGIEPIPSELRQKLDAWDPKRSDSRRLCELAAKRLALTPNWADRPRKGLMFSGLTTRHRQLNEDPLLGLDEAALFAGFQVWLLASGRFTPHLSGSRTCLKELKDLVLDITDETTASLSTLFHGGGITVSKEMLERLEETYTITREKLVRSDSFICEWFRYLELKRYCGTDRVPTSCRRMAELEFASAHCLESWEEVQDRAGSVSNIVSAGADFLAKGKAERFQRFGDRIMA